METLPREMILIIASFLDPKNCWDLSLTCSSYVSLLEDVFLWATYAYENKDLQYPMKRFRTEVANESPYHYYLQIPYPRCQYVYMRGALRGTHCDMRVPPAPPIVAFALRNLLYRDNSLILKTTCYQVALFFMNTMEEERKQWCSRG